MLEQDHRKVEALFEEFEQSTDRHEKHELVQQVCAALIVHMLIEEDVFYPQCRDAAGRDDELAALLDEAQVEHDSAKMLINELLEADPGSPYWEAKVAVLSEMIRHHVEEEEDPKKGTFAQARARGLDDEALAGRLERLKVELERREAGRHPIRIVALLPERHPRAQNLYRSMAESRAEEDRYYRQTVGGSRDADIDDRRR